MFRLRNIKIREDLTEEQVFQKAVKANKIKQEEIEKWYIYKKSIDARKKEDEILTNNIISVFGDKKFTSDYVKNGLIADIKSELGKTENKGKGISEIFESLTKDKTGLFENPNKPADMPGMGEGSASSPTNLDEMSFAQYKAWRNANK